MIEGGFQGKLLKALREHPVLKRGVIWKISDRSTRGIPDVLINVNGETTFLEIKVWPEKQTKIQKYFFKRLQPHAHLVSFGASGVIDLDGAVFDFELLVEEIVKRCVR